MSFSPIQQLFPNANVTDLSCTICTDDFKVEDEVLAHTITTVTPVPHAFHALCIGEWLKVTTKCPNCNFHVTHINGVNIGQRVNGVYVGPPLGALLAAASSIGNLQRVQEILRTDTNISGEDRGYAVKNAALNGHLDIVQALLANGAIPESLRGLAVREAAAGGHLDIALALLSNGTISDNDRETAIYFAAKIGHLNITRALLADGTLSQSDRGLAVMCAADKGHLDIVQALLANGSISEEDHKDAALYAAQKGYLPVVQFLIPNRTISDALRQKMLSGVEKENPINAAEIRAFIDSLESNNEDILNI